MNQLINKQYNYLGQVPEFRQSGLPSGYLINKGKVGCGGTSLALEDNRDTIVCVPFVSLIKNKIAKYGDKILGVYQGVTKEDIAEYLKRDGVKKIMCTYDSLEKVADVCGYDYFLLVDELHLLFIQYVFRDRAVKSVLNLFNKFREWSFLTATPIEQDLMLEELKSIPTFNIDWENKRQITVRTIKCGQVLSSMRNIINDFIAGKIFGNCHIFINSVDSIAALIKACNLTDDNCRVIFSKNNSKYQHKCQGVTNGETTDPVKKINLYTSTCFEGCDLFDEEGKIYIVSDGAKSQTLHDISTQIRQIAGRIRNTKYSEITHLYKSTRYNEDLTYEQYKSVVLEEEKKAKSYVAKVNSDSELINGTKESTYAYVVKEEDGTLSFDPNRMKLDIYNYKCLHHIYSLNVNMNEEYMKAGMVSISSTDKTSDKLLKNENTRTTFKDAVLEYDEIMKRKQGVSFCLTDDERLKLLKSKYPYIDDAYKKIGMEQLAEMKYVVTNIKRVLVTMSDKLDNKGKVAKLLKTVKGFSEGAFITGKEIKEVLGNIYDTIGIKSKPSIDDFRDFAVLEDKVKKIDGKSKRGYIIQYIKIK